MKQVLLSKAEDSRILGVTAICAYIERNANAKAAV
jgi:hypothetical protein